ncbi:Uncharacterised protein [Mycobacterium tuberculosis]|nr:Uncharacterised protein [Mycobacterium tuberculosis]
MAAGIAARLTRSMTNPESESGLTPVLGGIWTS